MEDIGCHFKFEKFDGNHYHDTDLLLSTGRNCLRYIIRERGIKKLFLPYYLCESLSEIAILENVEIVYYHLGNDFLPAISNIDLDSNAYLYFVNYYGILRDKIVDMIDTYKNVIVDNTHDFFNAEKYSVDVIYNYRKYFGVPDGACIKSNDLFANNSYQTGKSAYKINEMVLRGETGEFFHYPTFLEADKFYKNEDLCFISDFTKNYLHGIDYKNVLEKRRTNLKILHDILKEYNKLKLNGTDLTYMYPFLSDEGVLLRKCLKENNIYSPMLWPNMYSNGSSSNEIDMANNIMLLPIDQRYGVEEMIYISEVVEKFYQKTKRK